MLSDVSKATKSPRTSFPVDANCVIDGEWKLITSHTAPDGWQGVKFPNSSSLADGFAHSGGIGGADDGYACNPSEGVEGAGGVPPPRAFPRLEPCNSSSAGQVWTWHNAGPGASAGGTACTKDKDFAGAACWNVQSSLRLIMWPASTTTNEQFALVGAAAGSRTVRSADQAAAGKGCISVASGTQELVVDSDCSGQSARGWAYDATTGRVSVEGAAADGGAMCVGAFLNGTKPAPPPQRGPCSGGCLFNVVTDPTEQSNVYLSHPDLVRNLSAQLDAYSRKFFKNSDKFENDCPAGTKNCACWFAKEKYGGFMGPYAKTDL
jgi:hypothetical protein